MKQHMKRGGVAALLLASVLTACGDKGGTTTPGGTGGNTNPGGNTGNTALRSKLAACPIRHTSGDPADVACLVGTYSGKTPDGADCKLAIRADRSYTFTSPKLTYTYTPSANSFSLFDHSNPGSDVHQVIWSMNDHIQADLYYTLNFTARFGSELSASDQFIDIKAKPSNQPEVYCKSTI